MNRLKLFPSLVVLVGVVLTGLAVSAAPQTRPAATEKKAPPQTNSPAAKAKQPAAGPFNGKLAAVDRTARTIAVGKRTFQITPETKLRKAGQPATLDDAVVGEKCSGYVKPTPDGKWVATTVNLGPKPEAKDGKKK